jgi:single-stranded-DNA-specific exonuclease
MYFGGNRVIISKQVKEICVGTKWIYTSCEKIPEEISAYCKDDLFAKLLVNRGIKTTQQAKEFLEPEVYYKEISPYAFSDMTRVVERISKAIAVEEKIIVYGDFDADGVTSTSLLYKTLSYLGANVDFYVPDRVKEGHGLNSKALINLKTKQKAKLIITVDNGVSNLAEIKLMKGFGVDVIVTDHHEAAEELPEAFAIINPKAQNSLKDTLSSKEIESLNYLAGVGVAYKVACALLEKYGKLEFVSEILPLVAIGTIADVVPLLEENRFLVRRGVECIKNNCPLGIKALIDVAGYGLDTFDAQSIAFGFAPRVNAIGRLEHAKKVVELFTSDNQGIIELNAKYMDDCNKIRQSLCENIFEEALSQITKTSLKDNKAIILTDNSWNIGIIGIVASKLCERFYRPVFILRLDEENAKIRCSSRSIEGLNLYETLSEVGDLFDVFGGHSMAAGFSADINNLGKIIESLNKIVNENLDDEFLTPRLNVEEDLKQSELTFDFVKKIQLLEPCGAKNPSPVFSMKSLVVKELKLMGSNSNHLKVFFEGEAGVSEGVFWGKSEINAKIADKIDIVFTPRLNTFMDKTTVQMELCDYKSEGAKISCPKIIDHRRKQNALHMFLEYLKTTKTTIAIFAENQKTLEFLGQKTLANAFVINRLNPQNADQLVFLDLPPNREVFFDIMQKTSAKAVHIIGSSFQKADTSQILKNCSGMLKYADSKLGGVVDIEKFSSKLNLSSKATQICIDLLAKSDVIEIIESAETEYTIKFVQSKDLTKIKSLPEFSAFEQEVDFCENFDLSNNQI